MLFAFRYRCFLNLAVNNGEDTMYARVNIYVCIICFVRTYICFNVLNLGTVGGKTYAVLHESLTELLTFE